MSKRDIADAFREAHETRLQRAFNGLGIDDAVKFYRKATTAEKRALQPMFMRKAPPLSRTRRQRSGRRRLRGCGPL